VRPLIVFILILSLAACDRQSPDQPQATQTANTPAGAVDLSHAGQAAPAIPFLDPKDAPATLATFRGKPLLVNLWATWCAPCIQEMPTLDALAGREAARFRTIVVSQDLSGRKPVAAFFAKEKFKHLEPYLDPDGVLGTAVGTGTLPTTIFYGADGKEKWRVLGAMDWNGEQAKKLIEDALGAPTKG
jgi:thiol-disulfide isomerase/thioredoxin